MNFMEEFRPRQDTVRLHDAMIINFETLANQVKAANDIQSKQLAEWFIGTLAGMYQWIVAQATDLADYSHAIISRVESDGGLDEDTFSLLTRINTHMEKLNDLFEEMKEVLPENILELGAKNKELSKELDEFVSSVESNNESEGEDEEPLFEDDNESSDEE